MPPHLNRRTTLGGAVNAAVPLAAGAASVEPDPIFAASKLTTRHNQANMCGQCGTLGIQPQKLVGPPRVPGL
jgi:hypothetical protein